MNVSGGHAYGIMHESALNYNFDSYEKNHQKAMKIQDVMNPTGEGFIPTPATHSLTQL